MSSEQGTLSQPTETPPAAPARPASGQPSTPTAQPVQEPSPAPVAFAEDENPFGEGAVRGAANLYGACSIEKFCAAGSLTYTHEDAQGWLAYPSQFNAPNFWRQDAGVQIWLYTEPYDHWQGTYGVDAVRAFYHSGHGGMDGNGVFYAPMGGSWHGDGSDCTAVSSDMHFAEEYPDRVNYIFWSTCLSCRVFEGQSPIRTWYNVNAGGFRMLFGFETVSWDSPNYGKFFWEEWKKGKSLSTAWLDASWRIAHDQAPSCVAVGATADEAKDRVFNERYLSGVHASRNWWWWRWYNVAAGVANAREPQRTLPRALVVAHLRPVEVAPQSLGQVAQRFGREIPASAGIRASREGSFGASHGDFRASIGRNGEVSVRLAAPNIRNQSQLAPASARSVARDAVRRFGLDQDISLAFDRVFYDYNAGGTDQGSGERTGPFVSQTVVQYRQMINELPVVDPSAGTVRVAVDNDGTVTQVDSAVRAVDRLVDQPFGMSGPPAPGAERPAPARRQGPVADETGYRQALAQEWGRRLAGWATGGQMPLGYSTVPGSTEVGYSLRGNTAVIVAREAIEVDYGNGFYKRYWVETPLFA